MGRFVDWHFLLALVVGVFHVDNQKKHSCFLRLGCASSNANRRHSERCADLLKLGVKIYSYNDHRSALQKLRCRSVDDLESEIGLAAIALKG